MRHSVLTQRGALRAKLLFGVAAFAAGDPALANQAATAPPDDTSKWSPYSSIGGSAGSGMVGGKLDFFVPLFQNTDSLVFLNLGIGTETKAHTLYNIGGGYRTEIDADWIAGAYVSYDSTQLQDNNNLGQAALGAELMSADWDVRLNGYIADNTAKPVPGEFGLAINGTTIAVLQAQDIGYSGFDGEVGYRVFSDDNTDVRVFIGGFHFMHGDTSATSIGEHFDFSYRDITGPKARAEVTVYDLDVLGNQSRLTLSGEIAHDDVRGTTGVVGATLRVALGNFSGGGGAQALGELDRRMVDPERRNDMVLNRSEFTRPEPVIIYGNGVKSQPTNTLLYVDNTQGVGTYANPTTFADATARPTTNAFIVLTSKQGPIMGGGTLQPGQTVVAGGETFSVQGVYSHATFSHLFDPSTNVTLMPSSPGANVITLAPNTTVHGFNIVGDFGNAIYGKNVQNVTIDSVAIEGTGGGVNGINIVRTVSGDQNVKITNTSVADVSGVGIRFDTHVTDGGTSNVTTTLNNVVVTRVGNDGLQIATYAGGGSSVTSHVSATGLRTYATGTNGVDISAGAQGTGSTISDTLAFSSDQISGPLEDGIFLDVYAGAGTQVSSNVSLSGLTIRGPHQDGIYVDTQAVGGGAGVNQVFSVSNATIIQAPSDDIALTTYAGNGGAATSNVSLSGVALSGAGRDGIYAYARATGTGSMVDQALTLSHVDASQTAAETFRLVALARKGAGVDEYVSVANATITGVGYNGLRVVTSAYDPGSAIEQSLVFSDLEFSQIGETAVAVGDFAVGGASIHQGISITNAVIADIRSASEAYGIDLTATAEGSGSYINQSASISNTSITDLLAKYNRTGIFIQANSIGASAVIQSDTLVSTSVTDAGTGIRMSASASDFGGGLSTVDQRATITDGHFDDNAYYGVNLFGETGSTPGHYHAQAAIYQGITIANATLDHNGIGFNARNYAEDGSSATQTANLSGVDISRNTYVGVQMISAARALGFTAQNVNIVGTAKSYIEISHNGGDGVFIKTNATSGGQVQQNIDLYYTNFDHNGGNGIRAINYAQGFQTVGSVTYYPHIQQNLLMGPGSISHNGANGIALYNTAKYGPAIDQIVQVYKMTVDHNGGDGLHENSTVTTFTGTGTYRSTDLHSNIYVYGSDLSHNGGNGISIHSLMTSPQYAVTAHGYSYLEQHITVSGSTVDHNAFSGFDDYAVDTGVFGINIQYVTLAGSSFSHNAGNGAGIFARQFFGPGAFGATVQDVTIAGSTFGHNAESGLYAYAYAGGNQGRTEQHFTVESLAVSATTTLDSHFDNNGYYGIALKHVAQNGVYVSGLPCTKAQGLTGGCAFVRATFAMLGGSADNNRLYGLSIKNYAGNYGAVYDAGGRPHGPTVYLGGVSLNNNDAGFEQITAAKDHSYAFSFVVAVDTSFDNNKQNGFGTVSYATRGSAILETNILYSYKTGTSADKNGNVGVSLISRATQGSAVYSQNRLYGHAGGISVSHNRYDGVFIATGYDDATARAQQVNYLGGNTISSNGQDGVALIAYGPGAGSVGGGYQFTKFVRNTIADNGRYGIYGVSAAGATQVIDAFAGMNTLPGNKIAKLHLRNLGSTQIIY
jgi:hypothetical protein